jgi:nitroimidazol reductase NimA-like FMN-containing flavoprotein (pyridoxamine 5'-phosphate oxidase superfamily)
VPRSLGEVQSFMNRERLASFATVSPKGEPHIVPVFFTYSDGKVYVQTDRGSVKVRNIQVDDRVAIAVYDSEEAVIVRGKGRVVENETEFVRRTQEHVDKYQLRLDADGRDSLGILLFNGKTRCVIEVSPKRTLFW